MRPVILFRRGVDISDQEEYEEARNHLPVISQRTDVEAGDLVIGRYSVLPFYRELERDIQNRGGKLINSFRQHQFIADMREWCEVLGDLTPKLYPRLQDLPETGPFVLKGATNSKKHLWNTHMFALTKRDAGDVYSRLRDDMLLADQEIYARDYVPLKHLMTGGNGLPVTEEYRFFICDGQILCGSFYWASFADDLPEIPRATASVPQEFLQQAIDRIGDRARFYVLDVARTAAGDWIVVEINDGGMSGLSLIPATTLYRRLKEVCNG